MRKPCCFYLYLLVLLVGCPHRGGSEAKDSSRGATDASSPAAKLSSGWAPFPEGEDATRRLVAERIKRAPDDAAAKEPTLAAVIAAVVAGRRRVIAGKRRIYEHLGAILGKAPRDAYLLWGVYHDAGGQLAAFRRLISDGGIDGLTHVVVEQFDASGRWRGISLEQQAGDDELLAAYLRRGDREAFKRLASRQRQLDYTAWKYGYLEEVMDLLVAARARGLPLSGGDMPRELQRRVSGLKQQLRDRLRELHCLSSLQQQLAGIERGARVAMIWGQSHLLPSGLIQFIAPSVRVVRVLVYGYRPGPLTPEAQIAKQGLMLTDDVLIPASRGGEPLVLLLAGPHLGAEVDRARDPLQEEEAAATDGAVLIVSADVEGELRIDIEPETKASPLTLKVDRKQREVRLASGEGSFVFHAGKKTIIGGLELPAAGEARLELDCRNRRVRQVVRPAAQSRQ